MKSVFTFLADEEIKHKRKFEDILSTIGHFRPAEAYPDEYSEYEITEKVDIFSENAEICSIILGKGVIYNSPTMLYRNRLRDNPVTVGAYCNTPLHGIPVKFPHYSKGRPIFSAISISKSLCG